MTENNLIKVCSTCKQGLSVEHFHSNKAKKDGLAACCKSCQKLHSKNHYEKNKQSYFDRNRDVRKRQKEKLLEIKKNVPCVDCGQTFHPYVMEFDHREPENKEFSMSRSGKVSDKTFAAEMEKCDLVCSNCHKMRTYKRHKTENKYVLAESVF